MIAVPEPALPELVGARINRVDGPRPGVFALSLSMREAERCALLIWLDESGVGWGVAGARPRGDAASALVSLLRKHLAGARIIGLETDAWHARICARRAQTEIDLAVARLPPYLRLSVDGRPIAVPGSRARGELALHAPTTLVEARAHAARRLGEAIEGEQEDRRRAARRSLRTRAGKLGRRLAAIAGDLTAARDAGRLRAQGSALLAELHRLPRGATIARLTDWTTDPPSIVEVTIDPARGPRGEAEALFKKARKLERSAIVAHERERSTRAELAALEALLARLESGDDLDAIEAEATRLGALGPRAGSTRGKAAPAERSAYRTFVAAGGRRVLVGKSARDNDALTRSARPHDLWLHARGVVGSHVIVPLSKGETCPPELLIDAAHLAARFSSARDPIVEVVHVPRRFVRKPRGSAPGAVTLDREHVLVLRVEPDRIERLLRSQPG